MYCKSGCREKFRAELQFGACVHSPVLLYGCETWAVKEEDTQRIERNDEAMIRWICGVSLKYERKTPGHRVHQAEDVQR